MNRGQIYLSTSLTEAFGTSIIEAASTGLFIVSTKVGGVPEILPEDMIEFARPDADGACALRSFDCMLTVCSDIINALGRAIDIVRSRKHDPFTAHERLRDMYSWATIAERTERVYDRVLAAEDRSLFERMARCVLGGFVRRLVLTLSRLLDLGMFYGPILCIITAVQGIFLAILDWLQPRDLIDIVPDMPRK